MKKQSKRIKNEIRYFSDLEHIWWGAKTPAGQRRYDNKFNKFKSFCKPKKMCKVLEIGSGDGEFTKRLVSTSTNIIATDITPEVIKRGRKTIKNPNVKFLVDDAEATKFPDSTFDIVCGVSILHHVNIKKALVEAFRVLKNGGQIFFTEPNLLNPHIYMGLHIPALRRRMEFSDDETALIRWKVGEMLESIGFKKFLVRNYDFLHPLTPTYLINLVDKIGEVLERLPIIKEVSGSIIIWARK